MVRKLFLPILVSGLVSAFRLYGQKPVMVVESTLKVGPFKEEAFYYGFAAGDKLIFNFEEANNKELKEIEIMELPSSSKFMDYKTKKIENKTIDIVNTGIYKFRFANSTILPKVCKFSIQRIPASESTQNFNTTVYTRNVDDTTYTTEQESYIDRTDTVLTNLQDRIVKLQAVSANGVNKSTFNFILSENTIAWSYYIYTDEPGKKVYEDAAKKLAANSTVSKFQNYGPLAAEAYGEDSYLKKLQPGKPINFWIVEGENADLFTNGAQFKYIKKGTVVNDYSRMDYRKGTLYFCFSNGTSTEPANITVKITSLHINEVLKTRPVQRILSIKPKTLMYLKN